MAYASDRLYNEVIRNNMGDLVNAISVNEILPHLPCLTLSDREEILARKETTGNRSAAMMLLDNLRRRYKWPEQFISALRACELWDLADKISEAYDRIRSIHPQRTYVRNAATYAPVCPADGVSAPVLPAPTEFAPAFPATVLSVSPAAPPATVPAPPPTKTPCPADVFPTVTMAGTFPPINSSPGPDTSIGAPALTEPPTLVSNPVYLPPESTQPGEPPLPFLIPDARLPSPVSVSTLIPSTGQSKVPVNSRETTMMGISGCLTNTTLSEPSSFVAPAHRTSTSFQGNKPLSTSQFSASSEKSKFPVAVIEQTGFVKHPIQDTNTTGTYLAQDSQNNPSINQAVEKVYPAVPAVCQERSQATAQPSASTDASVGGLSNTAAGTETYFSKPGVLIGEEQFSVSSDHLQISYMTVERSEIQPARPQAVSSSHKAEESVDEFFHTDELMIRSSTMTIPSQRVSSDPLTLVQNSIPRAMDNGFSECNDNSYPNQPVEDHYESVCQSRQTEPRTRVHTVEVSEGSPVENFSGQSPSMVRPTALGLNQNSETESLVPAAKRASHGVLHRLQSNPYLLATVAIGLTAVIVALRLKN